ncbi:MAG: type VI secretion system tip protein VgrG [Niabella sp.]|nr:type VI secretion system tip protein VgrG [Niabella sp.]
MPDPLASIPPGTQSATDVVTCKVFINGTPLSNEVLLQQLSITKTFNKIAAAKIVFLDGSVAERNFSLSNDDRFKPGNTIKVQLGYLGDADTVFEGVIIKHGIRIRQQGASVLVIEAKDKAVKLTMARKSAYHLNKTDTDIIRDLLTDYDNDVDTTTVQYDQLVQFDATDWDFILTRAEANGMFAFTDNGKVLVKQPANMRAPVLKATYGDNIRDFEAEMDVRRQLQQVTSQSWDFAKQQVVISDPGNAAFSENGNISSDDLGMVLGAEVQLSHTGNLAADELQAWSNAYALRNHLLKIAGRVSIQGQALVKPGDLITLDGVGDRFNGNVFVTGVLQQYEGAWQTDIQFGWREDWFYKKEDVMDKPASGLLPGINGLQIGVVKDIEDPQSNEYQYRIRVQVPVINSDDDGIWARVATLDAGAGRGVYFRPQVGDEVVVGFLNDDPREAIILGCLHSNDQKKSPLPETTGKEQYGIVTNEKMKLIFDDSDKKIMIVATTGSGEKSIVMNDNGAFELKDEYENHIKMDTTGITIQSNGKVVIKGVQVLINS